MRSYDQVLVDIVKYVYHYTINDPKSFRRARVLLLDSLGCAMESLDEVSARRIIGPPVPETVIPDGFRLPGTDIQIDPVKGAFDLATLIRYLDHNDALGGVEWGHPSDNLGAIVAVMDWLSRSSHRGKLLHSGPELNVLTLLIAMIKAYEIQGCFQVANSFNAVSIDHTILVKVASTAVTSWLFGLTENQALAALSQAWMDGHPLRTFRAAPNTIARKGWAAGDACMRAVHLVMLTRAGQDGSPNPLTAERWGFYSSLFQNKEFDLPVPYGELIIHKTLIKLIACEGHGLTAAEAALQLSKKLRDQGLDPAGNIRRIEVRTHLPAIVIIDKTGDLFNAADRDHCMQYIIAVVLLKGTLIDATDYQDGSAWASDPRIMNLRERMVLREDKAFTKDYYDPNVRSAATAISILLENGSWIEEAVVHFPMGHPSATNTHDDISGKFSANVRSKFSEAEAQRLQAALEDDKMPVHEYVNLWVRSENY